MDDRDQAIKELEDTREQLRRLQERHQSVLEETRRAYVILRDVLALR